MTGPDGDVTKPGFRSKPTLVVKSLASQDSSIVTAIKPLQ